MGRNVLAVLLAVSMIATGTMSMWAGIIADKALFFTALSGGIATLGMYIILVMVGNVRRRDRS